MYCRWIHTIAMRRQNQLSSAEQALHAVEGGSNMIEGTKGCGFGFLDSINSVYEGHFLIVNDCVSCIYLGYARAAFSAENKVRSSRR